jgi:hypothetical protein
MFLLTLSFRNPHRDWNPVNAVTRIIQFQIAQNIDCRCLHYENIRSGNEELHFPFMVFPYLVGRMNLPYSPSYPEQLEQDGTETVLVSVQHWLFNCVVQEDWSDETACHTSHYWGCKGVVSMICGGSQCPIHAYSVYWRTRSGELRFIGEPDGMMSCWIILKVLRKLTTRRLACLCRHRSGVAASEFCRATFLSLVEQ